jgi:hypothetical protein
VTESAVSFYSGMLPGAVSCKKFYLNYLFRTLLTFTNSDSARASCKMVQG